MFETGLSFFQNKSYRTEYDKKLKQLRNHIQPKQIITYKLKLSPEASCNLKSCPLELKPAKLSDTIIQFGHKKRNESKKKKRKHHRSSKSKPKDVQESKSVQTNVDDSILSGLQTVIDLCGLLEKCEEKKHKAKKSKRKIKKSRKYSEFTNHSYQTALETSTSRDSISFDEICDSPSTKKFSTEIRSFRKLFSSTSNANPPAEPINESLYRQSLHVLSSQQLSVPEDEIQNELRKQLAISQVGYGDIPKKRPDVSNCSCFVANMTPIEEESLICFNSSNSYCEKVEKSHSTSVFSEHCSEQQISSGPSEDNLILSRHPDPIYPMNLSCLRVAKQDVSYENQMQEISSHGSSLQSISGERPNTSHSVVGLVPDDVSISENRYSGNFPDSCVPNRCPKLNKCDNPHCLIPNPEVADYSSSSHCNPSTCPNLGSRQFDNSPTLSQPIPSCSACSNSQRQVTLSTRCFSPVEVVPTSPTNTAAVEVDNKEQITQINYPAKRPERVPIDCNKLAKSQSSVRTPHRHVSIYEPDTLCNPDIREPLYNAQIECKKSRPGIPLVQPIVGICSSRKCGRQEEHLKSIRYALVKISEFMGFNTYEIMKPYKEKPKHIPTCIAEIFVTSSQKQDDGSSVTMEEKYPSVQFRDPSKRSVTGLRSKTVQPCPPVYVVQEDVPYKDASIRSSRRSDVICGEYVSLSEQQAARDRSSGRVCTPPSESTQYVHTEGRSPEPSVLPSSSYSHHIVEPSSKGVSRTSYAEPIASVRVIPTEPSIYSEITAEEGTLQQSFADTQPVPSRQTSRQISQPISEKSRSKYISDTELPPIQSKQPSTLSYRKSVEVPPSKEITHPSSEPLTHSRQPSSYYGESVTIPSKQISRSVSRKSESKAEPSTRELYTASEDLSKIDYVSRAPSVQQKLSRETPTPSRVSALEPHTSIQRKSDLSGEPLYHKKSSSKVISEEIDRSPGSAMSYREPLSPSIEQPVTSQQSTSKRFSSRSLSKKSMKEPGSVEGAYPEEIALSREPSTMADTIQSKEPSAYSRPASRTSYGQMSNIQQKESDIDRQESSKKSIRRSSQQMDASRTSYMQPASKERSVQRQPSLSYHESKPSYEQSETIAEVSRSREPSAVRETSRSREPSMHSKAPSKISSKGLSETHQRSDFDNQRASKRSLQRSSQQIDSITRESSLQQQPPHSYHDSEIGYESSKKSIPRSSQQMDASRTSYMQPASRERSVQKQPSLSYRESEPSYEQSKTMAEISRSREPSAVRETSRSREPSTHSKAPSRISSKALSDTQRSDFDNQGVSKRSLQRSSQQIDAINRESSLQQRPPHSYHDSKIAYEQPETISELPTPRQVSSLSKDNVKQSRSREPNIMEEAIRSREPSMHSRSASRIGSKPISDTQQHSDLGDQYESKKSLRKSSQQINASKIRGAESGERSLHEQPSPSYRSSRNMESKPSVNQSRSKEPSAAGLTSKSREPSIDNKDTSKKSIRQSSQKISASKIEATPKEQSFQRQRSYHEPEVATSREISSDRDGSETNNNDDIEKSHSSQRDQSLHSTDRKKSSRSSTHQSFHSTRSRTSENNRDTFYLIQSNIPNYKQNLYHCVHLPK